jgi:hypothetical protein
MKLFHLHQSKKKELDCDEETNWIIQRLIKPWFNPSRLKTLNSHKSE